MQQHHVQPTLRFRHVRQQRFEIHVLPHQKQIECARVPIECSWINSDSSAAVVLSCKVLAELGVACGTFFRIEKWVRIPIEKWSQSVAKLLEIKIRDITNQPMRGQNSQSSRVRVYKRHHRKFMSGQWVDVSKPRAR